MARRMRSGIWLWLVAGSATGAEPAERVAEEILVGLPAVTCVAEQTGGFHDYPGGEEVYEPALFHPQTFSLEENTVFMMNLTPGEGGVDLYLTLTKKTAPAEEGAPPVLDATELECRRVRGAMASTGFSCVNLPPSEMLLINSQTLRYTRTAVGGWTFAGASGAHNGDSIFVEYGQCVPSDPVEGVTPPLPVR